MTNFCAQCGKEIDSRMDHCPYCGAMNTLFVDRAPRTIGELRQFAAGQGLPLDKMHMHLGENYTGPKAYGIYKSEDGLFVVYKNKADGTRAVRYHGPDEARAVNELYQKMLEQMTAQRDSGNARRITPQAPVSPEKKTGRSGERSSMIGGIITVLVIICIVVYIMSRIADPILRWLDPDSAPAAADTEAVDVPVQGYYQADDTYYFYTGGIWFRYDDDAGDWAFLGPDAPYDGSSGDHYLGGIEDAYDFVGFFDSDYYLGVLADGGREYYTDCFASGEPYSDDYDYYDDGCYYDGYYYYGGYYYDDDDYYYYYDDDSGWFDDDYDDYDYSSWYDDDDYSSGWDDDDDYDYDYSSWDSGGSDWDSDW